MNAIKFSHRYGKMPGGPSPALLIEVLNVKLEELSQLFLNYDTTIYTGGQYKLPKKGDYMILMLLSGGDLWTTIRRRTPEKEKYYRSQIGQQFEIVIAGAAP